MDFPFSRLVLTNEYMVFGLECRPSWTRRVSVCEVASLLSILQNRLKSTLFEGGLQKFTTVRTLLRMVGSTSRLLIDQLQFIISAIIADVNSGRLEGVQIQWLPLMKALECIIILFLTFVIHDVVMVVVPSIASTRRGSLTTSFLVSSASTLARKILSIVLF